MFEWADTCGLTGINLRSKNGTFHLWRWWVSPLCRHEILVIYGHYIHAWMWI